METEQEIKEKLNNVVAQYLSEKLIESENINKKIFEIKQTKLPRKLKKKYKKERRICFDIKIFR